MTRPLLHYTTVRGPGGGEPRRLLVLHGMFGQGRNWASVASALTQLRPEWEVLLADLREHGRSRGLPPPHRLEAAAADVAALAAETKTDVLLGHSFGAKVALVAAHDAKAANVWIADADPSAAEPRGDAPQMLALLRSLPKEWPSRERFVGALVAQGIEPGVAGWMATNLERTPGGFAFALDLDALDSLLRSYFATDLWPVVEGFPRGGIHVIRATGSPVLGMEAVERFTRAGHRVHDLRAGHWVNAEAPGAVAELLAREL